MANVSEPAYGCTCFRVRKLMRTMSRLYDQHLSEVGLKTTQYSLLKNVGNQARPVAVLAADLAIDQMRGKPRPSGRGQERGRHSRPVWCI